MRTRFLGAGVNPPLDGVTPVFEMVGAAPTSALLRPPGSIVRFGTDYYWNAGTLLLPAWVLLGEGVERRLRPVDQQLLVGGPVTSVDLDLGSGGADFSYEFECSIFGGALDGVTSMEIRLLTTGGELAASRSVNMVSVNGGAPAAAGQGISAPGVITTGFGTLVTGVIGAEQGFGARKVVACSCEHTAAATLTLRETRSIFEDETNNMTGIRFVATDADGFAVPSRFRAWIRR